LLAAVAVQATSAAAGRSVVVVLVDTGHQQEHQEGAIPLKAVYLVRCLQLTL
jgi:signal recognition particle GTPase